MPQEHMTSVPQIRLWAMVALEVNAKHFILELKGSRHRTQPLLPTLISAASQSQTFPFGQDNIRHGHGKHIWTTKPLPSGPPEKPRPSALLTRTVHASLKPLVQALPLPCQQNPWPAPSLRFHLYPLPNLLAWLCFITLSGSRDRAFVFAPLINT